MHLPSLSLLPLLLGTFLFFCVLSASAHPVYLGHQKSSSMTNGSALSPQDDVELLWTQLHFLYNSFFSCENVLSLVLLSTN